MKTKMKKIAAFTLALATAASLGALTACGGTDNPNDGDVPEDPVSPVEQYYNKTYNDFKALDYSKMTIQWQGATNQAIKSFENEDLSAHLLVTCYGDSTEGGVAVVYQAGLWNDGTVWYDEANHIAAAYFGGWTYEYNDLFKCNTLKLMLVGKDATVAYTKTMKGDPAAGTYEIEFNDVEAENPAGYLYSYGFSNLRKYMNFYGPDGKVVGPLGHSEETVTETVGDKEQESPKYTTEARLTMEKKATYTTVAAWAATYADEIAD